MDKVVGFDGQQVIDLVLQGVNTIPLITLLVIVIRLGLLGIKALKIYIKNNS